ncbi:MAG: TolC family protein [Acidobacteriota bacterium]
MARLSRVAAGAAAMALALILAASPVFAAPPAPGLTLLEALRLTLENDPAIARTLVQSDLAEGSRLQAAATFDPLVTSGATRLDTETPTGEDSSTEEETYLLSAGVDQLLHSGLQLTPTVSLQQDREDGGSNVGTLAIDFRQPLLRGRGSATVTANLRAAEIETEAVAADVRQTLSLRLLRVAQQYWQVVAARRNLTVFSESERTSRELLETSERLVEADLRPAADLILLEADLTAKETSRIAGQQALFAARQNLGREIGLSAEAIARLPMPSDPLPVVAPEDLRGSGDGLAFVALALRWRDDLRAARLREEAGRILARAAENGLKPRLDLLVTPSYTGFVAGDSVGDLFSSPLENVPGVSTSVGLSLGLPLRNRRAEGLLLQAEALLTSARLDVEALEKQLGADVPSALDGLRRNAEQLERAQRSVELFARVVSNEAKKLGVGASTLIDVISQQDRQTAAQRQLVSAQLSLALALLDLRFRTGTLVRRIGDGGELRLSDFVTLPEPSPMVPVRPDSGPSPSAGELP